MSLYKISHYFPKPYKPFGRNIKIGLDLSNYTIKVDLKGATGVDTPNLATKSNLARLKAEVDKTAADKLKTVPADLSKLSHVVDNDVVKKTVNDELVSKISDIHTSGFVLKTQYITDKSYLEKKLMMQIKKNT